MALSLGHNLTIGILGYGQFGGFLHALAKRFLPDAAVVIAHHRDDFSQIGQCDAVILAVPISAYDTILSRLEPCLAPATILVDVATVKVHTMAAVAKLGRPYLAMHPMFGPESYEKRNGDVSGMRVVMTGHGIAPTVYQDVCGRLMAHGFEVLEKSAEDHDRELAETLFLTHYVGQVIRHGGFARTDIDTVSFGYLMDAVESVKNDAQLFADVCKYNPYCRDVIDRFDASDRHIRREMLGLHDK